MSSPKPGMYAAVLWDDNNYYRGKVMSTKKSRVRIIYLDPKDRGPYWHDLSKIQAEFSKTDFPADPKNPHLLHVVTATVVEQVMAQPVVPKLSKPGKYFLSKPTAIGTKVRIPPKRDLIDLTVDRPRKRRKRNHDDYKPPVSCKPKDAFLPCPICEHKYQNNIFLKKHLARCHAVW